MTDAELRHQVGLAVAGARDRLHAYSGRRLPEIDIDFSLRGRCAGQARLQGDRLQLRINLPLAERYRDDYLTNTIPHEMAHLHLLWDSRKRRRRPRPHGPEWQAVMRDCFGLEPRRCHDYETTPARVVVRKHRYRCACREHRLTSILHNRIRKGAQAACRKCRSVLIPVTAG